MDTLRDTTGDDFGHLVHHRPRKVFRPSSGPEVGQLIEAALGCGVSVVARGRAHSVFGHSQSEDGWVIDTGGLDSVEIREGVAIVGAGARWSDVLRAALARGLAPPVLTDYLGLSVGGTLSVGGVGGSSFVRGVQTDHVTELEVVIGTGEVRLCSAERDTALFDGVRAGLGQMGIMVKARVPLVRHLARVRHYRIPYASLEGLINALDALSFTGEFSQLSAVGTIAADGQWSFHIDAVSEFEPGNPPKDPELRGAAAPTGDVQALDHDALDYGLRLDAEVDRWHATGLWSAPHPWIDVLLPGSSLLDFAHTTIQRLTPQTLGVDGAMVLIYPIAAGMVGTPLFVLPRGEPRAYLFDVLRCVPGASPRDIEWLLDDNRKIYEDALSARGSLYPISAV